LPSKSLGFDKNELSSIKMCIPEMSSCFDTSSFLGRLELYKSNSFFVIPSRHPIRNIHKGIITIFLKIMIPPMNKNVKE
jgi:hypothetical protein